MILRNAFRPIVFPKFVRICAEILLTQTKVLPKREFDQRSESHFRDLRVEIPKLLAHGNGKNTFSDPLILMMNA